MIKAIAVDMDGTFLNHQGQYNHQYFARVLRRLQANDIQFIVASGNPYYQLQGQFPGLSSQLAFVAENGVECIDHDHFIYCGQVAPEAIRGILKLHQSITESDFLLSGRHHAFVFDDASPYFCEHIQSHYPNFRLIHDLSAVDDQIVKLQLEVPVAIKDQVQAQINHDFKGQLTAVTSGYGNLDIIVAGMDKATGLEHLLDQYQLTPDQLMAFGDGQNDVTMLKLAGESYAMQKADPRAIAVANHRAPSNDQDGVLQVIDHFLDHRKEG